MTPHEALRREVAIELAALERRLASSKMPDAILIRIEIDRQTGMPRVIDCTEERKRRILEGEKATRDRST